MLNPAGVGPAPGVPLATPEQIAPYRNGLVINESEVVSVREGKFDARKIRVAE